MCRRSLIFCKSLVSIGKGRATEQNLAESGSVRLRAARQLKEFYFLCINLFPTFLPISFHSLKTYLHLLQIRKNTNVFDVCALHFLHSLLKKTHFILCVRDKIEQKRWPDGFVIVISFPSYEVILLGPEEEWTRGEQESL